MILKRPKSVKKRLVVSSDSREKAIIRVKKLDAEEEALVRVADKVR